MNRFDTKRLDTLFPYPTPKIARIKDGKLGLLRWTFFFFIALYVVGFQILWRGNHLETQDLSGVFQLQLDHPTKGYCDPVNIECMQNFTSLSDLSYCAQSPTSASIKLPCAYYDAQRLQQLTDQGLLIPTHIATFHQQRGCQPTVVNNWTCNGWLYDFLDNHGRAQAPSERRAVPITDEFVADIERYALTVDHSVRSALGHRYYASDMKGYWLDCGHGRQSDAGCTSRPIPCDHPNCHGMARAPQSPPSSRRRSLLEKRQSVVQLKALPGLKGISPHNQDTANDADADARQPEKDHEETNFFQTFQSTRAARQPIRPRARAPTRGNGNVGALGVVSIPEGDIMTIGHLLQAANVSLDMRRHNVPSWVGGSYRSSGFVLVIRVHYTNIESWLGLKVLPWKIEGPTLHYTYRVTKHASHDDFMLRKVRPAGPHGPAHSRVLSEYHGIRILVEQSGSIAVWDNIQLLLILTTTLALATVSSCITDWIALNCMPNSEQYASIKFERPSVKKKPRQAAETILEGEETEEVADDNVMHYSSVTM